MATNFVLRSCCSEGTPPGFRSSAGASFRGDTSRCMLRRTRNPAATAAMPFGAPALPTEPARTLGTPDSSKVELFNLLGDLDGARCGLGPSSLPTPSAQPSKTSPPSASTTLTRRLLGDPNCPESGLGAGLLSSNSPTPGTRPVLAESDSLWPSPTEALQGRPLVEAASSTTPWSPSGLALYGLAGLRGEAFPLADLEGGLG